MNVAVQIPADDSALVQAETAFPTVLTGQLAVENVGGAVRITCPPNPPLTYEGKLTEFHITRGTTEPFRVTLNFGGDSYIQDYNVNFFPDYGFLNNFRDFFGTATNSQFAAYWTDSTYSTLIVRRTDPDWVADDGSIESLEIIFTAYGSNTSPTTAFSITRTVWDPWFHYGPLTGSGNFPSWWIYNQFMLQQGGTSQLIVFSFDEVNPAFDSTADQVAQSLYTALTTGNTEGGATYTPYTGVTRSGNVVTVSGATASNVSVSPLKWMYTPAGFCNAGTTLLVD